MFLFVLGARSLENEPTNTDWRMDMHFSDYDQVWVLTHSRTPTPTGEEVGHMDDWAIMATAAHMGWGAKRVDADAFDGSEMVVGALNIICDFLPNISVPSAHFVVFDHHDPQNPTSKCSAHQLFEELVRQGLMREVPALMQEISAWDVLGPNSIPAENRPDPDKYFSILAAEPRDGFDSKTASFILTMLERSFSLRQLVDELFSSETAFGATARQIYDQIVQRREKALAEIVSGAVVQESPAGVRYATISQNPAGLLTELFSRLRVDVIIHPNERTKGAFSVVRDSNGRFANTPVAELVQLVPVDEDEDKPSIVFCHPGGFLLVVKPPFVVL